MNVQTEQLGRGPILPLLLRLAIPSIGGLLVGNLYGLVDRYYVGQWVGEIGLAALTAVMPISMIIWGVAILIGRGGQVLYSISLGKKNYTEVQRIFGQNIALSLLASALLTSIGLIFLDPLLFLFGVTDTALEAGRTYLSITLLGTPFILLGFQNNFIRAEGYSALAMFTQIIGAVINISLDWLLVSKCGLGMAGAAWATVFAQFCSALWVVFFFFSDRSIAKIRLDSIRFNGWKKVGETLYNGLSPFSIGIAGSLVWAVQNKMLVQHGGTQALAAFGVILTIGQVLFTPIFGVCMGMQPLLGYNYGANKLRRVLSIFRTSCWIGAAIGIPVWLTFILFPSSVMRIFVKPDNLELIELGAWSMRRYLLFFPSAAV